MNELAKRTAIILGLGVVLILSGVFLLANGVFQADGCNYTCWLGHPSPWFLAMVPIGGVVDASFIAFVTMQR